MITQARRHEDLDLPSVEEKLALVRAALGQLRLKLRLHRNDVRRLGSARRAEVREGFLHLGQGGLPQSFQLGTERGIDLS